MDLKRLNNIELANEMNRLTHRYGELSQWMEESDRRIRGLILEGPDSALQKQIAADAAHGVISLYSLSGVIKRELTLKQEAEIEKYAVLADLKKVELEMDRRVG
jgi:hypothetical protein